MKTMFKPLGLAAAVAAATSGYSGIVNAQGVSLADNSGLGDLAIVPYYTTRAGWTSGVSVINTSDTDTVIVKFRMRRALDSMDALDFNIILSPNDVYTGYVQQGGGDDENPEFRWYSNDQTCTAPQYSVNNGPGDTYFIMPNIYRLGADEGYIEVIGMAAIGESSAIAQDALHAQSGPTIGIPRNCDRVRDNFFPGDSVSDYGDLTANRRGVIASPVTKQYNTTQTALLTNFYSDVDNVLKVSYFIKSDDSGTEFGNDAVHIADFMDGPSMTNQKFGLADGDLQGFDYPDLNGGAVWSATIFGIPSPNAAQRGAYAPLRNAIGGVEVINDWSANETDLFTVDTDWVVTTPGQYIMTNQYIFSEAAKETDLTTKCIGGTPGVNNYVQLTGANCDFRDIPMTASFTVYDREERGIVVDEGDLVVSPQPPGEITADVLRDEVNVISWGVNPVLEAARQIEVPKPAGAEAGWSKMGVTQWNGTTQAICDITDYAPASSGKPSVSQPFPVTCVETSTPVPLVGFVAWQRNFDSSPDANYGRIVEHSYTTASSSES